MRLYRLAFALLALLAVPAVAPAEPIAFSYTTYGGANPVARVAAFYSPGDITFSLTPQGDVSWSATGGSVELGTVRLGPSPGPLAPDTYSAYLGFTTSVEITDAVTGQRAVLFLAGDAIDDWVHRSWDGLWRNDRHQLKLGTSGDNSSSTSAVLNGTLYRLSVRPEEDNQVGVYTLSATVTNPEPGTFVLAALGLVPLGARLVRRRAKIVGARDTSS